MSGDLRNQIAEKNALYKDVWSRVVNDTRGTATKGTET